MTTKRFTSHKACTTCSKKIVIHKIAPTCSICSNRYHPKCVDLTPHDVKLLDELNALRTWICTHCSIDIFPFLGADKNFKFSEHSQNLDRHPTQPEICKTCQKPGRKLIKCDL